MQITPKQIYITIITQFQNSALRAINTIICLMKQYNKQYFYKKY